MPKVYSYDEAKVIALEYFHGDEIAADAYLSKYALKADGDKNKILEPSPDDMHRRMAKEFARIEKQFKNPLSEEDIYNVFKKFRYIVPQGGSMAGIGNPEPVSLANCFVVGNRFDSYGAICKTDEELVQISKRRGGVGTDVSYLRPSGARVHNAAMTSSGNVEFMGRFSHSIREVAQSGRRGALMISCHIKHPSAEGFIDAKLDTGKVTGANISIKLDDEFMESVINDTEYTQQFPIESNNPSITKKISARKFWNKIMHNAWKSAEPGVLFWDNIINESTGAKYGERWTEYSVNPCAELPLPLYGSCILICMNLYSFVKNPFTINAEFDYELFTKYACIAQRLADDIIELEKEKIHQIITKIKSDPEDDIIKSRELALWQEVLKTHELCRRTGLGITALGDTLAALGLTYGTKNATATAEYIQQRLAEASYSESIILAKERGQFPLFNKDIELNAPFVQRVNNKLSLETSRLYQRYGRRNIACLTIAPTGTLSCLTQTTSGIECVFMPYYVRRRKVTDDEAYDFVDCTGDKFQEYIVVHPKLVEWFIVNKRPDLSYEEALNILAKYPSADMAALVEESPYHNATTRDVDWVEKVNMQGKMQRWVDHSISVTVNLPSDATEELVSEVYMTAYKSGCKGCTIYRDGSRDGVLIAKEDKNVDNKPNTLPSGARSKRKAVLPAVVDVIRSKGERFVVFTGIDNNRPYEVFAFKLHTEHEFKFFKELKQTTITKIKKKHYSLGEECSSIEGWNNILERFGSEEEQAITRMVSTMLRGGRIPLEEIIDQIIKSSTSIEKFSKILAINLQKFLKSGITLHEKCPNCGGDMISYEGCKKCANCGQSKCG